MAGSRSSTFRLKVETESGEAYELARAFDAAEKAAKKLSDPSLSPRALQRAVLDADIATEHLATTMKAAAATGGPAPPEMTAKLKGFESAVTSANVRAGELRDRIGDLKSQGNLAATSIETLAGKLGSAQGAAQEFANSSNAMVAGLAKGVLVAMAAQEAFKLLDQAAQNVVAATKTLGDAWVSHAEKSARAATVISNQTAAMHLLDKGMQGAALSADEYDQRLQTLISHANHAGKELTDFAKSVGVTVPAAFSSTEKAAAGMNTALALAFTKGKVELLDWASANEGRLKSIAAEYQRHGEKVPQYVDLAIKALERETVTLDLQAKKVEASKHVWDDLVTSKAKAQTANYALADSIEKVLTSASREIASAQASASAAYDGAEKKIRALKELNLSDEEYNTRKRAILVEQDAAVAASAGKEQAANKEAQESLEKLATAEGKTSDQMKLALKDREALATGTRLARDADDGLKGMAGELIAAMQAQEKTFGTSKTSTEKWGDAVKTVADRADAAKVPVKEFSKAFFEIGEGVDGVKTKVGELDSVLNPFIEKLNNTARAMGRLGGAVKAAAAGTDGPGGPDDVY